MLLNMASKSKNILCHLSSTRETVKLTISNYGTPPSESDVKQIFVQPIIGAKTNSSGHGLYLTKYFCDLENVDIGMRTDKVREQTVLTLHFKNAKRIL